MNTPTRIAIADDHAIFRNGLKAVLELRGDVIVAAEVGRAADIVPMLERTHCDMLLLDLQMDRNTLDDIETLARRVAVIVLTADEEPGHSLAALRAGARGVVFKRFAVETLVETIHAVADGRVWVPTEVQTHLVTGLQGPAREDLTPREREIVHHVAHGLHNAEVAKRLFISEQTVKTHLNNIFRKLGVRDRVELTLYALRVGLANVADRPC